MCTLCCPANEQQQQFRSRASLLGASAYRSEAHTILSFVESSFIFRISLDHSYRAHHFVAARTMIQKVASMKGVANGSLHLLENDKRKGRQHCAPSCCGRFEPKQWRKTKTFNIPVAPPETTTTLVALGRESLRRYYYGAPIHQEKHQGSCYSITPLYCITFLGIAQLLAPVQRIIFAFLISLDLYS